MKLLVLGAALILLPVCIQAFSNPILWEDLPDVDIRQYDGVYYYSASTFHYSPGAPILRSYDLFNWEYIGHSVPSLDFGDKYSMVDGQRGYVGGIWASFFGYHAQNATWFWGGCIDFYHTYIYSAPSVEGPWTQYTQFPNKCYYDSGLLIDDDGTPYVSYGNSSGTVWLAQLSPDMKSEVKAQLIWSPPLDTIGVFFYMRRIPASNSRALGTVEGTRMYKRNGKYYILTDHPSTSEWVLQADSPFGNYTYKALVNNVAPPVAGAGNPHQGGIVSTPDDQWYYMAFIDVYPGGRIPVAAPITWGEDGFPTAQVRQHSSSFSLSSDD